jgi:hypothetical protein
VFPSKTDTFGLVLLEALASGVPVAAFPVAGPRDVITDPAVGVLGDDLREACIAALSLSHHRCRSFAVGHGWESCARIFVDHVNATRLASFPEPAVAESGAAGACDVAVAGGTVRLDGYQDPAGDAG